MGFSLILRAFFSFPNECQFIECQFFWEVQIVAGNQNRYFIHLLFLSSFILLRLYYYRMEKNKREKEPSAGKNASTTLHSFRQKAIPYFIIFFIFRRLSSSAYFFSSIWFSASQHAASRLLSAAYFNSITIPILSFSAGSLPISKKHFLYKDIILLKGGQE